MHHYRRFATEDEQYQKITAGGGGAFLHPTHDFDFTSKVVKNKKPNAHRYFWRKNYPDYKDSRKLDWKNLYEFIFNNKTFGILTGALYALLAFLTHGTVDGDFTWKKALEATIERCVEQPLALIVVVLMLLGLVFFTDSNSTYYRRIAGIIHGLIHLTAIFFLGWLGFLLMRYVVAMGNLTSPGVKNIVWLLCILIVCFVGGYIIGSIIMGLYLFVSIHFFKRHDNEAFSAMKIEDYKNFLRLHIGSNGNLTIYPFKVERAVTDWKFGNDRKTCQPKQTLAPDLIEDPIVLK